MIKGIIFDLDMCILDTHTLTGTFFEPVLDALHASPLSDEVKQQVEVELWRTSLDDTIAMFKIPEHTAQAMRVAYGKIIVPDGIRSYGDEDAIGALPTINVLVTSGYRNFQLGKIVKLNIAHLFAAIIVDEVDDPACRKGKQRIFEELLATHGWGKGEVLVVGDNPHSELKAGKALGMTLVQTLRPTVEKWPEADHHISTLFELPGIVARLNGVC